MVEHTSSRHSTAVPVYDPSVLSATADTKQQPVQKSAKTHTVGNKVDMLLRISSIGIGVAVFLAVFGIIFPFFAGIGRGIYEHDPNQVTAGIGWICGVAGLLGGGYLALRWSIAASDKSLKRNHQRFEETGRLSIPMMVLGIIFAIVGLFLLVYGAFGVIVMAAFIVSATMLLGAGVVTGVAT